MGSNPTASICVLTRGIDITVRRAQLSGKGTGVADGTSRVCVKGHVVGCLRVDTLDDINLSTVRPIRTQRPTAETLALHGVQCMVLKTYKAGQLPH